MSGVALYSVGGVLLFSMGLYGLIVLQHLFRKVLAFNIMGAGVFLFLVSTAFSPGGGQPDPVPHAMVLTGIVVTVSATAFALVLVRKISSDIGRESLDSEGQGPTDAGV